MANNGTIKIEKIISVVDTREYEEVGDTWKPIPGSGEIRTCDRCSRDHEVHATVLLTNGSMMVVGTGCMKGENAEITSKVRTLASAVKTMAKLTAKRETEARRYAEYTAIYAEVEALPVPEITVETVDARRTKLSIGESWYTSLYGDDKAAREQIVRTWRHDQAIARGLTRDHAISKQELKNVEKLIEAQERKIRSLVK